MGMYDEFMGVCPHCGGEFYAQTKLFDDNLRKITVGVKVGSYSESTRKIQCKTSCDVCQKPVVAVIEKGVLTKFAKPEDEKPIYKEICFGKMEKIEESLQG